MHVDPNAPFPPYTNTLPAAIAGRRRQYLVEHRKRK